MSLLVGAMFTFHFYRWLENVQANLEDPGIMELGNEAMVNKLKMYNFPAELEWLR